MRLCQYLQLLSSTLCHGCCIFSVLHHSKLKHISHKSSKNAFCYFEEEKEKKVPPLNFNTTQLTSWAIEQSTYEWTIKKENIQNICIKDEKTWQDQLEILLSSLYRAQVHSTEGTWKDTFWFKRLNWPSSLVPMYTRTRHIQNEVLLFWF